MMIWLYQKSIRNVTKTHREDKMHKNYINVEECVYKDSVRR